MVMLPNSEIVFSDRMGNNGRIQKIGVWQHLALEFTSNICFAKEKPERWISSARQVYNVPLDGSWTLVGNGQTESFSEKNYFGNFTSTDLGPPKLLKLGGNYFFYYPAGTSVGIYRVIDQPGRFSKFARRSAARNPRRMVRNSTRPGSLRTFTSGNGMTKWAMVSSGLRTARSYLRRDQSVRTGPWTR